MRRLNISGGGDADSPARSDSAGGRSRSKQFSLGDSRTQSSDPELVLISRFNPDVRFVNPSHNSPSSSKSSREARIPKTPSDQNLSSPSSYKETSPECDNNGSTVREQSSFSYDDDGFIPPVDFMPRPFTRPSIKQIERKGAIRRTGRTKRSYTIDHPGTADLVNYFKHKPNRDLIDDSHMTSMESTSSQYSAKSCPSTPRSKETSSSFYTPQSSSSRSNTSDFSTLTPSSSDEPWTLRQADFEPKREKSESAQTLTEHNINRSHGWVGRNRGRAAERAATAVTPDENSGGSTSQSQQSSIVGLHWLFSTDSESPTSGTGQV